MITAEEDRIFRTHSPVMNYRYEQWFGNVEYNGRILNDEERQEFVKIIDETVSAFTSGIPSLTEALKNSENQKDDYHRISRTVYSVFLFVTITMCDCMVAGKYFILADEDYDKRFMRGKMKVIINEGFKKLYGYNDTNRNASEWNRLQVIMAYFPRTSLFDRLVRKALKDFHLVEG